MDKNIQELFTARIQNANLTIIGYSDKYITVQVPKKSKYVFYRLPYKSKVNYVRIINAKDGSTFGKKYITYTVEDLTAQPYKDKNGEIHNGTTTITIPRNKIFMGYYHSDLIVLDTKDEYDKYYIERLDKDLLLEYPKTMKLYFKGFKNVKAI